MKRQFLILGSFLTMGLIGWYLSGETYRYCLNELGLQHRDALTLTVILAYLAPLFSVIRFPYEVINPILVSAVIVCNIYATSQSIIAPKERESLTPADIELIEQLKTQSDSYQAQSVSLSAQAENFRRIDKVTKAGDVLSSIPAILEKRQAVLDRISEIQNRKKAVSVNTCLKAQIVIIRLLLELALIGLALSIKGFLALEQVQTSVKQEVKKEQKTVSSPALGNLGKVQVPVKAIEYQEGLSRECQEFINFVQTKGGKREKILQSKKFGSAADLDRLVEQCRNAGINVSFNGDKAYRVEVMG